ncbi:unnamed protein product [Arctia plantaginis]|uniref:Uncharacterized protein n=1 Tax=Arctia plantaginis TaxID=874455 RepID=A0A8S0Z9Y5_ARCPL|nr:unnamed protein product [Arctia plantaginis]
MCQYTSILFSLRFVAVVSARIDALACVHFLCILFVFKIAQHPQYLDINSTITDHKNHRFNKTKEHRLKSP